MAAPEPSRTGVDVVVPVYGAAAALRRCLASVAANTDFSRHRLLLVVDGPQSEAVEAALGEPLATLPPGAVERLDNAERRGFVATANRGLARAADRDAVLLNSDTEVTTGWVDKLAAAAASRPRVASVTPFSNHATICSLPRFLAENTLPAGYDTARFGRLVERVSKRRYPELPTGVGVCLYLRREALTAVGPFDEEAFGLGYGEETDWCRRAAAAGFVHLLDDATFIYHQGQGSFGASRRRRVRIAGRAMRRRHPGYEALVADFIRRDSLAPLRRRVVEALAPAPPAKPSAGGPARVVHLVHGWPPFAHGGTELYAHWLVAHQAERRQVAVYSRLAQAERHRGDAVEHLDGRVRVRLAVNNFTQRNPLSRNAIHDRFFSTDFARFLDEERPELIHVHHLAGHCASLLRTAAAHGVPVLYQIQDWWIPCARVNLFHRDGTLCSGPAPAKCAACLPLTARPPARLWSALLYRLRAAWLRRCLAAADAYVVGSQFIADSYRRLGLLAPDAPLAVLPYGVPLAAHAAPAPRPAPQRPLRFVYVGALLGHKGVQVAAEAFRDIDPEAATLDVWGSAERPELARALGEAGPAVRLRGAFAESEKAEILAAADALLVPSLGLESFGLVAREAMALKVPVLVSDRGALAELAELAAGVESFPPGDAGALAARIRQLIAEPQRLADLSGALPAVKGLAAHAEEIEEVYRRLLKVAR